MTGNSVGSGAKVGMTGNSVGSGAKVGMTGNSVGSGAWYKASAMLRWMEPLAARAVRNKLTYE